MLEQENLANLSGSKVEIVAHHIASLATLGATAVYGYYGQRHGYFQKWPDILREAGESLSHPILGYIGALTGTLASRFRSRTTRAGYVVAGATIANFSAEVGQLYLVPHSPETDFFLSSNFPETLKDYAFSLIGMGLFIVNQRRCQKQLGT
ncbi:hypothetical protein KC878_02550 [Candidatus Saccharibacteria bacterium]|nr:hypothetical protein [Candidatus Saccharibacteria bacterium]MCB9821665.1 hypothetical protein [Candidatus Nomurabacteria bacterium]